MGIASKVLGGAVGGPGEKAKQAAWRALRTLLQGVVGAFPAAGPGSTILDVTYWEMWWASVLVAVTAALVSFLQNLLSLFPSDT
jgi:hypothetical protein